MLFAKLLVDASAVGGQAKVLMKNVNAEGIDDLLDILAMKVKVERPGLGFEVEDDDVGWCSVTELTDIDATMAKVRLRQDVRLRRDEPSSVAPAPGPSPAPEDDVAMAIASNSEDDDEPEVVEVLAPAQPADVVSDEWKAACKEANDELAKENVNVTLSLVFAKGQGSTAKNARPGARDLLVICSACPKKMMVGGGKGFNLRNATNHAREQHGPN